MVRDGNEFSRHEVCSDYVPRQSRYVVSFVVGYDDVTKSPQEAAESALSLIVDDDPSHNTWYVFDRVETKMHEFKQHQIQGARHMFVRLYEVIGPRNTNEGRAPGTISYGYYLDETMANYAKRGKGVMGSDGEVKECMGMLTDEDHAYVFTSPTPVHVFTETRDPYADKRAAALAKLTAEERALLGLK